MEGQDEGFYHLHVKNIGRRFGRSIVAAAAYRAGETIWNEAEERESVFGGRRDVVFAEIRMPVDAPPWMKERQQLWNAVEKAEKRSDARLAKEVEFSLPRELPRDLWPVAAAEMADAYTSQGFVVDLAIHEDGRGHNPHVHLLLTTRRVTPSGFGAKLRHADAVAFITQARQLWQKTANKLLGKVGAGVQIDARSLKSRGIDREAGQHRGPDQVERRTGRARAAALRRDAMLHLGDWLALQTMLQDDALHSRYAQLSQRKDWPPVSREAPADLGEEEREDFVRYWQEVDERKEVSRASGASEEMRSEEEWSESRSKQESERLSSQRAIDRIESLTELLGGEENLSPEAQAQLASLRAELGLLNLVEEEHLAFKAREIEQRRAEERALPVQDGQGDLVRADSRRTPPISWSTEFASRSGVKPRETPQPDRKRRERDRYDT